MNYLLLCYHVRPNKPLRVNQQLMNHKSVRLFRYSYWLLRKSIFNLANRIFVDLCHVRGRKSRRIWDIEKASHTLLAHHLLIDNVQSVLMSAVTQRLVIQFSRYGHFCVKCLRVPIKTKIVKYIVIFGFYSLLAFQWYIVYHGFL